MSWLETIATVVNSWWFNWQISSLPRSVGRETRERKSAMRTRTRKRGKLTPYSWLGAGAVTLGISAAALSGAGIAYADDAGGDSPSASPSSAAASSESSRGVSTKPNSPRDAHSSDADSSDAHFSDGDLAGTVDQPSPLLAKRSDDANVLSQADDDESGDVDKGGRELSLVDVGEADPESITAAPVIEAEPAERAPQVPPVPIDTVATSLSVGAKVRNEEDVAVASQPPASSLVAQASDAISVDPTVAAVIDVGPYLPQALAASSDGRYIYAAAATMNGSSGAVIVIDAATNKVKKTITTNFSVTGIAVAPNGRVYASGYRPTSTSSGVGVVVVIGTSHRVTKTITLGQSAALEAPIGVTADGKSVVVGWAVPTNYGVGYLGALSIISTATQKVTRTVTFEGLVTDLALTSNSQTAVIGVANRWPAELVKIDLATGTLTDIDIRSAGSGVKSVTLTPGGVFAFVALSFGQDDAAIVHVGSGDILGGVNFDSVYRVDQIRTSIDGKHLFAVEDDKLYTVENPSRSSVDKLSVSPDGHYYLGDLVMSPNGRLYLSSGFRTGVVVVTMYPPSAAPILTVAVGEPKASTGVVDGAVTAADPNGNPVTFTVSAPARGAVMMTKYGAFKYTPTAAARHAAAAPGGPKSDSFVITANNGAGGVATVTITVTIAPKNSAPTASQSVGSPNADTGQVTGRITGRDSDKDTLSYRATITSDKGNVVVNSDGTFTYTATESARMVAGGSGARSADKTDKFTVTVSDGHGGTKTVTVSVKIAPLKSATTASKMWAAMDAHTPDKLTAQLVSSGGKKKMIVYMTGIQGLFENPDSVIDGALGNAGWLNPKVSEFIDNAVTMWTPTEIMLVGFSNGGQQMQNYAADGANKKLVKSLVMFAAPLTKKADQIGQTNSLGILDVEDRTYQKWTHADAVQSYNFNASDAWALFYRGVQGPSDTHHQGTYFDAAADFDKAVKDRKVPDDVKKIYTSWAKFDGNVVEELESRTR
ncbi:Ig-like domain-containing protein [Mycolicibacterium gilvum]|uniref:Ig-like domain-containing protein n=1 Tax=Mycolicibacterium gilvum TaxID=1804 RepID=UPI0040463C60